MEKIFIGFTEKSVISVKRDWDAMAKEPVTVELIGGTMYGFCSELAALRLGNKYAAAIADKTAKVGYSENIGSWFFRLEPKY